MKTEPPLQIHLAPDETPEIKPREPILRIPPVTFWLIAVNVLVHCVLQLLPPGQDDAVIDHLGFDPASLREPVSAMRLLTLITYQFLHGGWEHLIVNMISLLAFGAGVERALGKVRYLALYLVAGIAGALLQGLFTMGGDDDVLIGASGSISGVFGALLALWNFTPHERTPLGIVPMALLWIGLMALTGILGVGAQGMPVAWIAHIGGFIVGMAYGLTVRNRTA